MTDIAVSAPLYERDFAEWCAQQSALLENPALGTPDWANIREEIDGLAARDRKQLQDGIVRVIDHLLRMDRARTSDPVGDWQQTIWDQQIRIEVLLDQSPSLHGQIGGIIEHGFPRARESALQSFAEDRQADIAAAMPDTCPYEIDEILG